MSDDEIAQAAVYNIEGLKEKDSINFIEKRVLTQNSKEVTYYFYQIEKSVKEEEIAEKQLVTMAFVSDDKRINPLAYKSLTNVVLTEEDTINEKMDTVIKKELNEKHTRATFEKAKEINADLLQSEY